MICHCYFSDKFCTQWMIEVNVECLKMENKWPFEVSTLKKMYNPHIHLSVIAVFWLSKVAKMSFLVTSCGSSCFRVVSRLDGSFMDLLTVESGQDASSRRHPGGNPNQTTSSSSFHSKGAVVLLQAPSRCQSSQSWMERIWYYLVGFVISCFQSLVRDNLHNAIKNNETDDRPKLWK